jgi:hypothetical protein
MSTKPARKANNPHLGSDFDDFLREEGLYEEAEGIAVKRVLAYELEPGHSQSAANQNGDGRTHGHDARATRPPAQP